MWEYRTGGRILTWPAIGADGTIYLGSDDGYVYALLADGSLQWRFQTDGKVRASPAIAEDGTLYIASEDRYLYALGAGPTATAEGASPCASQGHALLQNAPNPFNTATVLSFWLGAASQEGPARLSIFDLAGQRVRTYRWDALSFGEHRVQWDGRDERGRALGSGVYLYRLTVPGCTRTRKMVLIE